MTSGPLHPPLPRPDMALRSRLDVKQQINKQTVRDALRPGDWVTSIDLTDAYFHILIHPSDRKWLRFRWGEKMYQFRALPFGLSLAPWIFTMVVRQLCSLVRQQGVRLRAYLDDWLILHQDREACSAHTRLVLSQAYELGFSVNQTKSELTPSQIFTYLGMRFDTVDWSVRPSQRRIDKLPNLVKSLASQKQAPAKALASVLGQMESMATLVPLGRVYKRPFQAALNSIGNPSSQGWQVSVRLESWFQQTTEQWLKPWISQGVLITPPPRSEEDLFTDASLSGCGAHLSHHTASGTWTTGQALSHINVLELEAVAHGLQSFLSLVAGKHVRLHTDNTTVAAYINRQGGSRSHTLSLKACQILKWCHQHQILLSAKHLPGKLNVLADSLSRSSKVLHTEWTITHHASPAVMGAGRQTDSRSFRDPVLKEATSIHIPVSGPGSLESECTGSRLDRTHGLRFPTIPTSWKSAEEGRVGTTIPDSSHSNVVESALVSGSPPPSRRSSHSSKPGKGRITATKHRHSAREPTGDCEKIPASVRCFREDTGFGSKSAQEVYELSVRFTLDSLG